MDQNQPPPYGQDPNGQQPQYGQPPPYGQPQYGQPQYGQPYGQMPPYGGNPYYGAMAPKPGCIPLRPLNLGEILSGAVSAIARNAQVVLPISAVVAFVQALLTVWIQSSHQQGSFVDNSDPNNPVYHWNRFWAGLASSFGGGLISLVFAAVLTGMMIVVVTEDVVGRKADFGLVWAKLRSRLVRLVLLSIFLAFVEALGLVLCIAPGVWLWGIWAVAVPAMMVENLGFGSSLNRSRALVSGTFWRVWGIRALCYLIATVAAGVISGIVGAIFGASGGVTFHFGTNDGSSPIHYSTGALIGLVIISSLLQLFVAPFKAAVDSLLYVDLRMRKEGLAADLQRAASQSR